MLSEYYKTTYKLHNLFYDKYVKYRPSLLVLKKHSPKTHSIAKPFHRRLQDNKNKNKLHRC